MYFIAVFLRWAMSFMIFYNKGSCVVIKIAIVTAAVVVVAIIIVIDYYDYYYYYFWASCVHWLVICHTVSPTSPHSALVIFCYMVNPRFAVIFAGKATVNVSHWALAVRLAGGSVHTTFYAAPFSVYGASWRPCWLDSPVPTPKYKLCGAGRAMIPG